MRHSVSILGKTEELAGLFVRLRLHSNTDPEWIEEGVEDITLSEILDNCDSESRVEHFYEVDNNHNRIGPSWTWIRLENCMFFETTGGDNPEEMVGDWIIDEVQELADHELYLVDEDGDLYVESARGECPYVCSLNYEINFDYDPDQGINIINKEAYIE
jgi:hypothetical protein